MCEGITMTDSVSSIQMPQTPAASGLSSGSGKFQAGHFVVNPQTIRPYSFYDELKKGDNFFNEALQIVASNKLPSDKAVKHKKPLKKVVKYVLAVGLAVLAFVKRKEIFNFLKKFKK